MLDITFDENEIRAYKSSKLRSTHLVQCLFNLLEQFWGHLGWINALDLATKVCELGGIGRSWQGKWNEFDGHCMGRVE